MSQGEMRLKAKSKVELSVELSVFCGRKLVCGHGVKQEAVLCPLRR